MVAYILCKSFVSACLHLVILSVSELYSVCFQFSLFFFVIHTYMVKTSATLLFWVMLVIGCNQGLLNGL